MSHLNVPRTALVAGAIGGIVYLILVAAFAAGWAKLSFIEVDPYLVPVTVVVAMSLVTIAVSAAAAAGAAIAGLWNRFAADGPARSSRGETRSARVG